MSSPGRGFPATGLVRVHSVALIAILYPKPGRENDVRLQLDIRS